MDIVDQFDSFFVIFIFKENCFFQKILKKKIPIRGRLSSKMDDDVIQNGLQKSQASSKMDDGDIQNG